jgi:hypothetical protein
MGKPESVEDWQKAWERQGDITKRYTKALQEACRTLAATESYFGYTADELAARFLAEEEVKQDV